MKVLPRPRFTPSNRFENRRVFVIRAQETETFEIHVEEDIDSWSASGYEPITQQSNIESLKARIFMWICRYKGRNAREAADALGLPLLQTAEIVEELLNEGLLDFND